MTSYSGPIRDARRAEAGARVWDFPTRLWHWSLVILLVVAWSSADAGKAVLHEIAGSMVLALVLFRVCWGFCGSSTARFSHFVRGPRAVAVYARGLLSRNGSRPSIGHNPIGGWSILLMLGLLALQTLSGLFAVDAFGTDPGPLARYVSFATGRAIAEIHGYIFDVLATAVAVHVLAVLSYLIAKRRNLVWPMITGRARVDSAEQGQLQFVSNWRAAAVLAVVGALVAVLVTWI